MQDPSRPAPSDFAAFYRDELPRTIRSIEPIVGLTAEDVAQEAFIVALGRWADLATLDAPGAWVRLVARRMAWRRRERDLERTMRHAVLGAIPGDEGDADARLDLRRALRGLPTNQRMAVRLHYLADLPVQAVAEHLGSTESTVRVWLHRARNQLAGTLLGMQGRWTSEHRWTPESMVRRMRATGDRPHVDTVIEDIRVGSARWMLTLNGSSYRIETDDGLLLDDGTCRIRNRSLELIRVTEPAGTVVVTPAVDGARATFRQGANSTGPTLGVPDRVWLRLLLEADRFVWKDPARSS